MIAPFETRLALTQFIIKRSSFLFKLASHALRPDVCPDDLARDFGGYLSDFIDSTDFSISHDQMKTISCSNKHNSLFPSLNDLLGKIYNVPEARIGSGGSSISNVAVLGFAIKKVAPDRNIILLDQNSHQSTTGGVIAGGYDVGIVPREISSIPEVSKPLKAIDVEKAIKLHGPKNIAALQYTACCYDGFRNIDEERNIYNLCNRLGILVSIDGAWGATHGLFPSSPPALTPHADCVILSPHKKGLTPSPLGIALFNNSNLAAAFDEAANIGLLTTSPPFILKAAAEYRLSLLYEGRLTGTWEEANTTSQRLRKKIQPIQGFTAVNCSQLEATHYDPSHILLDVSQSGFSGFELNEILTSQFNVVAEKATFNTLLWLIGPSHIGQETYLAAALSQSLNYLGASYD